MDRIAVREDGAVDWVKRLSGRHADLVCDPTMLLTAAEWDGIVQPKPINDSYVLVYFDSPDGSCLRDARAYAARHGLDVSSSTTTVPRTAWKMSSPPRYPIFSAWSNLQIPFSPHPTTGCYSRFTMKGTCASTPGATVPACSLSPSDSVFSIDAVTEPTARNYPQSIGPMCRRVSPVSEKNQSPSWKTW